MKRFFAIAAVVAALVAVLGIVMDQLAAAQPIPAEQHPYTYVIETTNGAEPDAGTAHEIYFSGAMAIGDISGSFGVALEPNGTSRERIGPYDAPLHSLSLLLNGMAFDAPDNWKPMRIRVVEQIQGVESRVVVDHNPWQAEFNNAQRSHQVFDEMMAR